MQVSFAESFANSLNNLVNDLLDVLLACESLLVHELQELLVHDIIFNRKECLNELPNHPKSCIITNRTYF